MYKKRKKTRRYANGGVTADVLKALTEYGGGDASRGVQRFVEETKAKEGELYGEAFGRYGGNMGVGDLLAQVGYQKAFGDKPAQDVYIGEGKEGPLTARNYSYDKFRTDPSDRDFFFKGIPFNRDELINEKRFKFDETQLENQAALARRRLDHMLKNPLGTKELTDEEYMRRFPDEYKEHGGMVDDSNQPDSITNYIKGHDNNNDMKQNKKYRMGGMPNDDDNFSKKDSTDVYNYRQMRDFMGEDPVLAHERRDELFGNPDVLKNLKRIKELNLNMGDLGDFNPNMKHGGMVKKSKGGHRDPFTNQYD